MIRRAEEKDIPQIMALLGQVCNVHAKGRPDLFVMGGTKYDEKQLKAILADDSTPVFACCGDDDVMVGYAFCVLKEPTSDTATTDIRSLYIDDICVDENARGQHIGTQLYEAVKAFAKEAGCYNITLNVWEKNPAARAFYEAMGMSVQKTCMEELL
ncbi:GNAT family N-acetyltransferase [Ruminococcus sp.]|uniref:GNAT family N-acetyltransferase n=1 Tax=Ruminococcus sp. TaxID=41978 RepID=UPI0025F613EA|nr:GNAT family N-acetyltransferase [Ruminococcus sp.]MBQ8967498.1 GNAT family N-acetyltransferase [Ruminococcus sp.]